MSSMEKPARCTDDELCRYSTTASQPPLKKMKKWCNSKMCYKECKVRHKTNLFCRTCFAYLCFPASRNCFTKWRAHHYCWDYVLEHFVYMERCTFLVFLLLEFGIFCILWIISAVSVAEIPAYLFNFCCAVHNNFCFQKLNFASFTNLVFHDNIIKI